MSILDQFRLDGKVALVTGCRRGIGAAMAEALAEAGAELMTKLPRVRGRIVVVAIFAKPPNIDLFRFFWRELKLCGARVYEHQDFETAIKLAAAGAIPIQQLITAVYPLDDLQTGLEQMEKGGEVMKVLVTCK